MKLNTLRAELGSKSSPKRVGRGIGSGLGKTCGRGHKGQKARSGGYHKINFEGGQMPIQRRLPKFGFTSRVGLQTQKIRLHELNGIDEGEVTLDVLKAKGIINKSTKFVKIFLSGELSKKLNLKGLNTTKGARQAIETAGGSVEE